MFILQCQNVKSISQIVLKRAETDINPIILNGVLNHVRYTVIAFLFAYLVITYYSLQFLSNGDTK